MSSVSAIILTYNSEEYVERCVLSVYSALMSSCEFFEIFVVDNGSSDQTCELLKKVEGKVANSLFLIFLKENVGTTCSRNLALSKASGDYILVMDSDAYIDEAAVKGLRSSLEQDSSLGLVGPKLVYPDGRFQQSFDKFPTIWKKICRAGFLRTIERLADVPKEQQFVDYLISAVWMLPKLVVDQIGLLDENIFYSPEDVDYCVRIKLRGYEILYNPSIKVVHDAQERSRSWMPNRFTVAHAKGLLYYFLKYKYFFRAEKLYRQFRRARKLFLASSF